MSFYILRRLGQSALTIFGVMILTFLLFRVVAGDIAAANLGEKATQRQKADWMHRHEYDRPWVFNLHRNLLIEDRTQGNLPLGADDAPGSLAADSLALILAGASEDGSGKDSKRTSVLMGRYVFLLSSDTPIGELLGGKPLIEPPKPPGQEEEEQSESPSPTPATAVSATRQSAGPRALAATSASAPASQPAPVPPEPSIIFSLADRGALTVDLAGVRTCGELVRRINEHPDNKGRVLARISELSFTNFFNSQFFHHLANTVTFQSRSLKDNRKLTEIITRHAPYSLAVQIPALGVEWAVGLAIACFVAYYRGTWIDKLGVFLSVLGMCIPFLAFMIYGQWLMFALDEKRAYGLLFRSNVYVPIAIMVIAGLGGNVRFYRTVILDETSRDYVRTAKAKGVPLPGILFKHVLRNCMLPIMTSLIMSIPFLIMGSLLVESYFGIPGLGDLMITSIQDRNEPIMSGMVFLTALIYTSGVLLTDISYAVFDPRIRLR